jgi:hypothetical protein
LRSRLRAVSVRPASAMSPIGRPEADYTFGRHFEPIGSRLPPNTREVMFRLPFCLFDQRKELSLLFPPRRYLFRHHEDIEAGIHFDLDTIAVSRRGARPLRRRAAHPRRRPRHATGQASRCRHKHGRSHTFRCHCKPSPWSDWISETGCPSLGANGRMADIVKLTRTTYLRHLSPKTPV